MSNENKNTDEGIDFENFNLADELAKFKGFKADGWNIAVRLYTEPVKMKSGLYLPDLARDEQKYQNFTGLVIDLSPSAYTDVRYSGRPWCKVGDWIIFPRHSGHRIAIDGKPVFIISEDAVLGHIDDPRRVSK